MADNSNNGLMTKIWGPSTWVALHSISFGYPLEPSDEQKKSYKEFFKLVGDVLPCRYCRDSYKQFIITKGTELNDDVMKNRHTLTEWLYNIHQAVNNKLGVDYGVSLEDIRERYESYRASCVHTNPKIKGCDSGNKNKIIAFNNLQKKDCPIIDKKIAKKFINYAKCRGIDNNEFYIINNEIDKTCKDWSRRNQECYNIIKNMRENGIPSIEPTGMWKGWPTMDETKLILRRSTTLSIDDLNDIVNKYTKKYKILSNGNQQNK